MWSFGIIVLLCTVLVTSGITFEYRIRCPDTLDKWRENSESYICDGDTVYHCMQNREGHYVVFCASSIWIQPDYCPEFNSRASAIDVILCPGDPERCPETVYLSNAVYQFPSCYRLENSFRTSTPSPTPAKTTHWNPSISVNATQDPQVHSENDRSKNLEIIIPVGIIVPVTSIVLLYFYCKCTNQRKGTTAAAPKTESHSLQLIMEEQSLLKPEGSICIEIRESVKDEEKINRYNENIPEVADSKVLFYEPKDYKMVVDTLQKEDIVLLLGKSGSGKTTIANHLAKTEFQEYKTKYMKPPKTKVPKLNKEKTLILWDDCLGVWNMTNKTDNHISEAFEQLIQQVKDNSDMMKAIVCMDSSSVEEGQLNQLTDCVGQINLDKYYETQWEKEGLRDVLGLKIGIGRVSMDVGFPLLMHLINVQKFCSQESTPRFLEEPVAYIRDDIDSIFKEQRDDYVALIYTINNGSKIDLKKINIKIWGEIEEECLRIVHKKTKEYSLNDKKAKENTLRETDDELPDHNGNVNTDAKGHRGDVVFVKDSGQNGKSNNRISTVDRILNFDKGNLSRQTIKITEHLARYLVDSNESSEYKFRHQFLAECTLRYHIEHVGKETILMKGPDELRMAVTHLQSEIDPNESDATK